MQLREEPLTDAAEQQAQLAARIALLERERSVRDERIELLRQENQWLKNQLYARSSEKTPVAEVSPDQARLAFNEAEALAHQPSTDSAPESLTIPTHERKKSGRKALPEHLPRVQVIHDLPEDEKHCAQDGTALEVIGRECTEQLDYVPAKLQVIEHVRLKYACPCCKQGVKLAAVAPQLLPKSNATPRLLAHITTAKYVDGTPLYRQEAQFARLKVHLPRATMARWLIQLGTEHVVPLINLLNESMLDSTLIHMDETALQVLKSDKAPSADHWMWVRASGPPGKRIVLFDYDPSRGGAVPQRLLAGFSGVLLSDGWDPYAACAAKFTLTHAGCWAHARRKFEDARKVQIGEEQQRARSALDLIGQLYGVERQIKTLREAREKLGATLDLGEVRALRIAHSTPVLTQLKTWLEAMAGAVATQSTLGKAVKYTLNQWAKLITFLDHPHVPLDNNRCENALRPFVIGRKNWLFCDTQAGASASANLYSLIETAKANGIEPHAYLTHLFTQLPTATTFEHVEALLPWNVKPLLNTDQ